MGGFFRHQLFRRALTSDLTVKENENNGGLGSFPEFLGDLTINKGLWISLS